MKFGAHIYIFIERWSDDALHVIDTAKELGLDCLEIALGDDVKFDPKKTKKQAEKTGLELVMSPGGVWPDGYDISSPVKAEREKGFEWHRDNMYRAAESGASAYTGALYGKPGVLEKRRPHEDEYERISEGLHGLAELGVKLGMKVVLEPMSRFRTHLVNKPSQVLELISRADHDNLYALLDTYHMTPEIRDFGSEIVRTGEKLWGLHACENDRGVPGGGIVPWDDVFSSLKHIKFDGYVIMESYNTSIPGLAQGHMVFGDVCPDGKEFVTEGLSFLKDGLM